MNNDNNRRIQSSSDISNFYKQLLKDVKEKNIPAAFDSARNYATASADFSNFSTLNRAEETYKAMLRYDTNSDSNEAEFLYGDTREALLTAADTFKFNALFPTSPSRYYSTARNLKLSSTSIADAITEVETTEFEFSVNEHNFESYANKRDNALLHLFNIIWTTHHLSHDDHAAISQALAKQSLSTVAKQQILAALLLAQLSFYDYYKLDILASAAENNNPLLAARGIVGILLTTLRYRSRLQLNPRAESRINALLDNQANIDNLTEAAMSIVRAMDTDRINHKMQTDIIPGLRQLQNDLISKIGSQKELLNILDPEKNPEWDKLLEKSGMGSKLRDLTDMQLEGSDVMMLAFAQLKNFSFFTPIANWFLPFIPSHASLNEARSLDSSGVIFKNILESNNFLCDSDKYSLAFSFARSPQNHRQMMVNQLQQQFEQLSADQSSSLKKATRPQLHTEIMQFIRNLYRFYRLNPQKSEFDNPFKQPFDISAPAFIGPILASAKNQELIAEFYFSRGYYEESIPLLTKTLDFGPSASTLQKLGYAYSHLQDYNKALHFYSQSQDLFGQDLWLLKQKAHAFRALGRHAEAAEALSQALALNPDNISLTRQYANALLNDHRYAEALKLYYKIEYKDGANPRNWRPVAWCEFMEDNYLRAGAYYDRLLESDEVSNDDKINAAHLALVTHDSPKAIELYLQVRRSMGTKFRNYIEKDFNILNKKGIRPFTLNIILDRVEYEANT